LHLIFNAYWEALDFDLPTARWRRWIDSSYEAPDDIADVQVAPAILGTSYRAAPRSVVALFAAMEPQPAHR
jgi:glycogen operon protein